MELLDGRYELLAELGRGAFGQVLRARDHRTGREVAIKLLSHALEPEDRLRFQREGELTARLDHPHVLRVHGAGLHGASPYLVYELVPGARTLRELLDEGDLPTRVARVQAVAAGLAHAHAQGVIHRDLKPENVLVDAAGRIRVADFGLATAEGLERLTQTGQVLGTPTHMAPEQVEGRREAIGPATDVWALGVLLYRALCGQPPFPGTTFAALALQIVGNPPSSPSCHAPVPAALEALCLRALARDPARRPPDAGAFAAELEAALAAPDRRRPGWVLALALLAGAVGLTALGLALREPDVPAPAAASAPLPKPPTRTARPSRTPAPVARPARSSGQPAASFPLVDPTEVAFLQRTDPQDPGAAEALVLLSSAKAGWQLLREARGRWERVAGGASPTRSIAVEPDEGRAFAVLDRQGGVHLSDASLLEQGYQERLRFLPGVERVAIDPKANYLAHGGVSAHVALFSRKTHAAVVIPKVLDPERAQVWGLAFADGETLVAACGKPAPVEGARRPSPRNELVILGRPQLAVLHRIPLGYKPNALAVGEHDGRTWVAVGGAQGALRLWSRRGLHGSWREGAVCADRFPRLPVRVAHPGRVTGLAIDARRGLLISVSAATSQPNDVAEWPLSAVPGTVTSKRRFLQGREEYANLALDRPGRRLLLSCRRAGVVELWPLARAHRTPHR